MKLDEIVITQASAEPSIAEAELFLSDLLQKSKPLEKLSSNLEIREFENRLFILVKNEKAVCWLELGEQAKIGKNKYDTIKIIYALPEVRNTYAVGAFIVALKRHIKKPLILGSDSYGGVLFKDGVSLVKKLHKSAIFDVKILNLISGKKKDFEDLKTSKNETLIFELKEFPICTLVANGSIALYTFEDCENWDFCI